MEKDQYIRIRVSRAEKEKIKRLAAAENRNMSAYILRKTLATPRGRKQVNSRQLVTLLNEINRIGNNINQAVKIMNIYKTFTNKDYESLQRDFDDIKRNVKKFIKECS